MDDFETAIMLSLDPTVSGEVKEKANRYCDSVRTTPDAWKFCVEKIYKTSIMQVRFFCFQVLQDLVLHGHAALSESDRTNLKMFLLNWMRDCTSTKQEDLPVKNKYAQLMAFLMKTEYPDQWPTFFRDILNLLNGASPPVVDLFLRIIKAVDDEVVSHELQRSTADVAHTAHIKDAMREGPIADLVHVWYELLSVYKSSPPALINMCLETLRGYVGWIDIGLIVNEKFMTLLFQLLGIRSFSEEVVECLYEIVCKGMEPRAKFNLLKQLNIKSIIIAAASNDTQFMTKVGKLTNTMGVELIACMDNGTNPIANGAASNGVSSQAEMDAMLAEMLALLFKTMNNESDEVAASVLGFADKYVNRLKNAGNVTSTQIEHLEVFLQIIRNKAKYSTSFDFDDQDEEEKEFLDFRRELTTTYRNILRIIPERSIEFVRLTLTAVSTTPPAPFPDSEIALQLFYQIGEVLPSNQDPGSAKLTEQFFSQTMISLSTGPLSSHPHQSVSLAFFDCAVRYAKYIPPPSSQPQILVSILTAFFDARGLRHPSLAVRKKVAVSFRQFVRAVRAVLYPYLDNIVNSLKDLLVISFQVQKNVPFEDQVNFYESLGVLIGSNPDMGMQQKHTEALMQPVLSQLEEILAKELYKTDITSGKPYYTIILSQLINVIATFSKGFVAAPKEGGGRSPSPSRSPNGKAQHDHISSSPPSSSSVPPSTTPPVATPLAPSRLIFVKSLELVLRVPVVLPTQEDLRDKVFTFLHRMVEILGPTIFPVLPNALALLLTHSTRIKDIQEFVTLTNQVTARFKETVFALVNDMLMPFVRRMFELLNPSGGLSEESEEQREWQELQKSYYVFLQCTLANNLASVFTSSTNAPHFQQILSTVVQGCSSKDLSTQKVCVAILRRMIEEWGGLPTFTTVLFEQIVPRLFEMAMSPNFNISDAATNLLATELAKVLKLVYTKTGQPFATFLATVYLPSIHCPTDATQQFVQHLDKTPLKQFTDVFKEFTRISKVSNLRTS